MHPTLHVHVAVSGSMMPGDGNTRDCGQRGGRLIANFRIPLIGFQDFEITRRQGAESLGRARTSATSSDLKAELTRHCTALWLSAS